MTPHRIEVILDEDGKLSLDHLPFLAGQAVEVTLVPVTSPALPVEALRGSVLSYERPTDPVAENDWDAQIERDEREGRLDALIEQAIAEHKAGRTRPL